MLWALLGDLGPCARQTGGAWARSATSPPETARASPPGRKPLVLWTMQDSSGPPRHGLDGTRWPSHRESQIRRPRWRGSSSVEARGKQSSSFRTTTPVGRLISGQWTGSSAPGGCMGSRLLPPSCSGRAANFRHSSRSHLLGCATGWVRPPDSPGAGSGCRPGRAGQQTGCVFHLSAPAPYSNRVA